MSITHVEMIADDGSGRLKLYKLGNGYTFASRKGVPVVRGNDVPDAVMIVARDDNGRLLVVYEDRPVVGGQIWDIPAGMIEPGESPVDAAKREVYEETGLALDRAELWKYNPFVSPGMVDESNAIVTGFVNGEINQSNLQGDENIKAYLLDADEMARLNFGHPNVRMSARLALLLL